MRTLRTQIDYFQRLIPLLTDHFTVYVVDLPGQGWSDIQPGAQYAEPAVRRAMVELLTKLGLTGMTLAGKSMGARVALTATGELGVRV